MSEAKAELARCEKLLNTSYKENQLLLERLATVDSKNDRLRKFVGRVGKGIESLYGPEGVSMDYHEVLSGLGIEAQRLQEDEG